MASITYSPQSFAIDGRRVWIVGASLHYARIPEATWAERIADVRQAGFNTIETPVPWFLHEPRRGRYRFEGRADIAGFIRRCGEAGLNVILRVGPFIGEGYDGGGLPRWIGEEDGIALREASEPFVERAGRFLRKLAGEVSELQVTNGGPLLLVQCEHAWTCGNPPEAERYLMEMARMLRENGIAVPVTNANDLWVEWPGTIDTWRGAEDLLSHVRQLRTVQPDAPRIVSAVETVPPLAWGDPMPAAPDDDLALRRFAEVLAAGGQGVVAPFHGGTNLGFIGGTLVGAPGRGVTTAPAPHAPLGEAGERTESYRRLRRLAHFAAHFGHVFADLEPDYHPSMLDPATEGNRLAVVSLRGGLGRVVFVFASGRVREGGLLLDNGTRLPIHLGDSTVGWYVLDVDLRGQGRLDFTNLSPFAIVGRSMVVLHGHEKMPALLSVGGTVTTATVPSGRTPLVMTHKGITFVICNRAQIDAAYHDDARLYVGADGLDPDGEPRPAAGFGRITVIESDGTVSTRTAAKGGGRRKAPTIDDWSPAPASAHVDGSSPRFAGIDGPMNLVACGAPTGYGWYRVELKVGKGGRSRVHLPDARDRAHLFLDGEPVLLAGAGPGAADLPAELRLTKGTHVLTALVENAGRADGGNDLGRPHGLGHVWEVKALRTGKPKTVEAEPVDPFELRGFIAGRSRGRRSDTEQLEWAFTHARKAPILLDIDGAAATGTIVLNDVPLAYYAGTTGAARLRLLLVPGELEAFRRGKNVLRFAPDAHQDGALADIAKHATLLECANCLTDGAKWSFAKWEAPPAGEHESLSRNATRNLRGTPTWWRGTFTVDPAAGPLRFDTTGLSKGQLSVNGRNVGRYFTQTREGKSVGPQTRLLLPAAWLEADGPNELLLFDEHGFDPARTGLTHDGFA